MGSVNGAFVADDARSHVSGYSMNKSAAAGNLIRSRSLIDGQSARSVSAMSGRGGAYLPPAMHHAGLGQHLGMGMGLGGLAMPGLGGSMNAMAGLPTLTGMGLSRAGRTGCSTKTVKTINDARPSKTKAPAAQRPPTGKADEKRQPAGDERNKHNSTDNLNTSTTALVPAESASSTETLSSTQA